MPGFIKTPQDEELWHKAKEIVQKQYKKSEADGDEFWRLVTGVYKKAGGSVSKALLLDVQELDIVNFDLQKSITRKDAKAVHGELPMGGEWRTMNGHHVYIKDGKILAGSIPGAKGAKKATKAQLSEHQNTVDKERNKTAKKPSTTKTKEAALKNPPQVVIPKSGETRKKAVVAPKSKVVTLPKRDENKEFAPDWQEHSRVRVKAVRTGSYAVHGKHIKSPEDLATMFADLADNDREKLYVVAMKGTEVLGTQCVHIGTINSAPASPKDMLKLPVLSGADSFYILHNHPSGDSGPSKEDRMATERMAKAGESVGLKLKGHAVIGDDWHFIGPDGEIEEYRSRVPQEKLNQPRSEGIDIFETQQEKKSDVQAPQISGTSDLEDYVKQLGIKNDGKFMYIVGVDNKNKVTHAEPIAFAQSRDRILKDVTRSLIKANCASFFVAMGKDNQYLMENAGFKSAADSIGVQLYDVMVPHDWRDDSWTSYATTGKLDVVKSLIIDLRKGIAADLEKKYPGGHWVSMRGKHVYIMKNGKVAPETDPKAKSDTITNKTKDKTPTKKTSKATPDKVAKPDKKATTKKHPLEGIIEADTKKALPKAKTKGKNLAEKPTKLATKKSTVDENSSAILRIKEHFKGKEPWEIPWSQYKISERANVGGLRIDEKSYMNHHKRQVSKALADGKAVPKVVLDEYPDLKPKKTKKGEVADIHTEAQKDKKIARDVGQKVWGSRKDKASIRAEFEETPTAQGLEALEDVAPELAQTLCVKKNLLKPVNFEADMERGVDVNVAMTKQLIYDRIAAKPMEDTPIARQHYLRSMQELQRLLEPHKTWDEFKGAIRYLGDQMKKETPKHMASLQNQLDYAIKTAGEEPNEYNLRQSRWNSTTHQSEVITLTPKEWKAEKLTRVAEVKQQIKDATEASKKPFFPLGDKLTKFFTDYESRDRTLTTVASKRLTWDKYFGDKEAKKDAPKKESANTEKWEKTQPDIIKREGGRKTPVKKPEDMVKAFGFRGVEFGHYVDDKSGNFHLVKAAEAFHDLADIVGMDDKDISLNGRLAMAFGARGSGRALAHYEPDMKVINMTKDGGAGSLAHEWSHALDNILYQYSTGRSSTNMAADGKMGDQGDPKITEAYDKLMFEIKTGAGTGMGTVKNAKKDFYRYYPKHKKDAEELGLEAAIKKHAEAINSRYTKERERLEGLKNTPYGNSFGDSVDKKLASLDRSQKQEINSMIQEMAYHHKRATGIDVDEIPAYTGRTQYYMDSMKVGGNKENSYWTRPHELFARAFETYVQGKMSEKGNPKNDYLVFGAKGERAGSPYPRGEEAKRIGAAFEELLKAVKNAKAIQKALAMLDAQEKWDLIKSFFSDVFENVYMNNQNRNAYNVANTEGVFWIPINRLQTVYQTEKALNFDKIRENVEKMKAGENLEPVVIGYNYDVHDGQHRIESSKIMNYTHVPCIVGGSNALAVCRAEESYSEIWKSLSDRRGEGWFANQAVANKHKELGYGSENPPYLTAKAQGDYGRVWAQVWTTGMDWNCYYYMLDSEHDEPRLIALADDNETKGEIKSLSKEVPNSGNKRSQKMWQDICEAWVSKRAKQLQKSLVFVTPEEAHAFPFEANGYVFRGVGQKELDYIQEKGQIKTKGKGNDADQEKTVTCFSNLFSQAEGYARGNYDLYNESAAYVLVVNRTADMYESELGEVETTEAVPIQYIMWVVPVGRDAVPPPVVNVRIESKSLQKALGLEKKYPGGHWLTMRGKHVYIKKDGTVAPETDPKKGAKSTSEGKPKPGKDKGASKPAPLARAKSSAKQFDSHVDWAYHLQDNDKEALDAVSKHKEESSGKKLKDLFDEWGGGSEVPEWKPVNTKAIDDFEPGEAEFEPSEVRFVKPRPGRTAQASAEYRGDIHIGNSYEKDIAPASTYHKEHYGLNHVVLHEMGHVLSNAHRGLSSHLIDNPQEALGRYNQKKGYFAGVYGMYNPEEAWAESFATYHTDPTHLRANHPKAYEFVENALKKMPNYREYLKQAGKELASYRKHRDNTKLPSSSDPIPKTQPKLVVQKDKKPVHSNKGEGTPKIKAQGEKKVSKKGEDLAKLSYPDLENRHRVLGSKVRSEAQETYGQQLKDLKREEEHLRSTRGGISERRKSKAKDAALKDVDDKINELQRKQREVFQAQHDHEYFGKDDTEAGKEFRKVRAEYARRNEIRNREMTGDLLPQEEKALDESIGAKPFAPKVKEELFYRLGYNGWDKKAISAAPVDLGYGLQGFVHTSKDGSEANVYLDKAGQQLVDAHQPTFPIASSELMRHAVNRAKFKLRTIVDGDEYRPSQGKEALYKQLDEHTTKRGLSPRYNSEGNVKKEKQQTSKDKPKQELTYHMATKDGYQPAKGATKVSLGHGFHGFHHVEPGGVHVISEAKSGMAIMRDANKTMALAKAKDLVDRNKDKLQGLVDDALKRNGPNPTFTKQKSTLEVSENKAQYNKGSASATSSKKIMADHGIPAAHREELLSTLSHKTTVNFFRPGEDGFEVQGSKKVEGREYSTADVQKAITEYKSNPKLVKDIEKKAKIRSANEAKVKAERKSAEEERRNFIPNLMKKQQEERERASKASEDAKKPIGDFGEFDPFELLMNGHK